MRMRAVHVDPLARFSLEVDDDTGLTYLGIPVRNTMVEYTEWYLVDRDTFATFVVHPSAAWSMVQRARRREGRSMQPCPRPWPWNCSTISP